MLLTNIVNNYKILIIIFICLGAIAYYLFVYYPSTKVKKNKKKKPKNEKLKIDSNIKPTKSVSFQKDIPKDLESLYSLKSVGSLNSFMTMNSDAETLISLPGADIDKMGSYKQV